MDSLVNGQLVLTGRCLRINSSTGESHLIVWPHGFSLFLEKSTTGVTNARGRTVARVGDKLTLGGGEVPATESKHVATLAVGSLPAPADCPGPYWLVG